MRLFLKRGVVIDFTDDAWRLYRLLTEEQQEQLMDTVKKPAGKYKVDTADNFVSVYGTPLSFIRDHEHKEISILTTEEARELDEFRPLPTS